MPKNSIIGSSSSTEELLFESTKDRGLFCNSDCQKNPLKEFTSWGHPIYNRDVITDQTISCDSDGECSNDEEDINTCYYESYHASSTTRTQLKILESANYPDIRSWTIPSRHKIYKWRSFTQEDLLSRFRLPSSMDLYHIEMKHFCNNPLKCPNGILENKQKWEQLKQSILKNNSLFTTKNCKFSPY